MKTISKLSIIEYIVNIEDVLKLGSSNFYYNKLVSVLIIKSLIMRYKNVYTIKPIYANNKILSLFNHD